LIGQDYAIWGFFANFNLGAAKKCLAATPD
jgi:hypothetical protein